MDDQWPALVAELNMQTGASRDTAQQWVDLGQERGWSVANTRQWAADCIAHGVSPAEYRQMVELSTAMRLHGARGPFARVFGRLRREP